MWNENNPSGATQRQRAPCLRSPRQRTEGGKEAEEVSPNETRLRPGPRQVTQPERNNTLLQCHRLPASRSDRG